VRQPKVKRQRSPRFKSRKTDYKNSFKYFLNYHFNMIYFTRKHCSLKFKIRNVQYGFAKKVGGRLADLSDAAQSVTVSQSALAGGTQDKEALAGSVKPG
jgi:uncharacterized protein YaaR (DUF327 family)